MLYVSENKLLLDCIGIAGKKDKMNVCQTLEISKRELNWTYILRNAQQNGLAPLLYHNLETGGGAGMVPVQVWRELMRTYHCSGFQNACIYEELKNVLQFFKNTGIKVIVLKGAALAEEVWKNVALRQMADIDLLMREENLDKAGRILSELGYVPFEGFRPKEWYVKNLHHLAPYDSPAKGVRIEIHHNIVPPNHLFSIDIHQMWERAQTIRIGGVDTQTLSPEDLIVHLCLHISYSHSFVGKIRALTDIPQVVRHYGERINWDWVIREAVEHNFADFVYYPLYLARDILNMEIEEKILDGLKKGSQLKPFEDRLLKLVIKKNILLKDRSTSIFPAWFIRALCKELLRNAHTHQKIGSLLKTVLQPGRKSTVNISPSPFQRSGYLIHPVLCLLKRILELISKLCGRMTRIIFNKIRANFSNLDKLIGNSTVRRR